jgi:hypothetical protein
MNRIHAVPHNDLSLGGSLCPELCLPKPGIAGFPVVAVIEEAIPVPSRRI